MNYLKLKDFGNLMIVLAFDISTKRTGWAVGDLDYVIEESGSFKSNSFVESYTNFNSLITKWKPVLVICPKPTNRYNVIRALSEMTGVLRLICEKKEIDLYRNLVDSSCKKVVLGNGRASKKEIMNHYGLADEDEADARMMWDYYKITNNEK